jgi:hypothetical protein
MPKVVAHVPTNIKKVAPGFGVKLIKVAMPNGVMWVTSSAKARPTATPIAA